MEIWYIQTYIPPKIVITLVVHTEGFGVPFCNHHLGPSSPKRIESERGRLGTVAHYQATVGLAWQGLKNKE